MSRCILQMVCTKQIIKNMKLRLICTCICDGLIWFSFHDVFLQDKILNSDIIFRSLGMHIVLSMQKTLTSDAAN